jgi:hypothetical protein
MADHFIRDPMTLDEERRAMTTTPDASPHLYFVRGYTPARHKRGEERESGMTPLFGSPDLDRVAGAILGNDCDNER